MRIVIYSVVLIFILSLVFFTLLLLDSCKTSYYIADNEIKTKFTNKFQGSSQSTGIDKIIKINGYYQGYREHSSGKPGTEYYIELDTTYSNCIFFEDGLFLHFSLKLGANKEEISKNLRYFIPKCKEGNIKGIWGIYRIENELIIVQTLTQAGMSYYSLTEMVFKVIDNETLKLVSRKPLQQRNIKAYGDDPWANITKEFSLYRFNKTDSLPESKSWIKELEWTWKNNNDWKNYMDSVILNK